MKLLLSLLLTLNCFACGALDSSDSSTRFSDNDLLGQWQFHFQDNADPNFYDQAEARWIDSGGITLDFFYLASLGLDITPPSAAEQASLL
ncbi:MAG: hypothetical protein H8E25_17830 [Planctomycetes bacterium]|nr:hypothetical protein [Planctomycetota bacterium]